VWAGSFPSLEFAMPFAMDFIGQSAAGAKFCSPACERWEPIRKIYEPGQGRHLSEDRCKSPAGYAVGVGFIRRAP
jgi:hypothetical protein